MTVATEVAEDAHVMLGERKRLRVAPGSPDINHKRDPLVLDDARRTLDTQLPLGEMLTV